ncbi:MAG: TonB-dependent receptor, partial [Kordiimonas sp.]
DTSDSFAQEVRLTSSDQGSFRWIVGAFYFKRNRSATSIFEIPGIGAVAGAPSDIFLTADIDVTDEERALYGELSYDLSDKLEATLGMRWFRNEAEYRDQQTGIATGGLVNVNDPDNHTESKLTPKFVLAYKVTDDALLYASAAKGYRIGGTNIPIPVEPSPPASFGPDSLWNYEVGVKTSWYENRLIFNAAFYYIDWTDIQVELDEPTTELSYTSNGGQAYSKGIEIELIGRPMSGLQLTSALAWNKARMDEDVLNPDTGIPFALQGDRMPGARDFTISNSIEYTRPVSDTFDFLVRADHQYVGNGFSAFLNAPRANLAPKLPSYTLVNLRVGLTSNKWDLTLYADNLFNNDALVSLNSSGNFAFQLKPRTMGINVRTQF